MKFTYPASMERIVPQEIELSTTKVPPINSYGNFAFHEATLSPWQENSLFSQCKNRHSRNLKTYFVYNFQLPVLHYPYLVILERVGLDYTQSKFGKNRTREFEIIKKSNLANAKSPIQDWLFGKTSIAYTMPILYNRAILALI